MSATRSPVRAPSRSDGPVTTGLIAQSRERSGSMNTRKSALGAAVVMGALVALAGLPAGTALAGTGDKVPCSGPGGGAAGLVAAINAANAAGGGTITLAPGCTYR